ncbi:hypothetical protein ETH_00038230 [Eimeria tenella]|uniref:Cysteine-rich transmembrane CYSTM domain-containing protein n=1 Tax=Eimeria tenella TaxID=5802 RepID=U6KQE6_EIMTE|nr:hypothetical protein ETH_00038230 [Eimeria tenella]CDJ39138.1 hypothetical protein ETH_00038230 [Eimeria tenella]|eukprot:XP_013229893.1 hypothetical protein ETH_00038230 [Eimeria tenella]
MAKEGPGEKGCCCCSCCCLLLLYGECGGSRSCGAQNAAERSKSYPKAASIKRAGSCCCCCCCCCCCWPWMVGASECSSNSSSSKGCACSPCSRVHAM